MTWTHRTIAWPESASRIEHDAGSITGNLQDADDTALNKLRVVASRGQYHPNELAAAAAGLAELRGQLDALATAGQLLCVTPYQHGVGLRENGQHYLAPANAAKALAAKLADQGDTVAPSGRHGMAMMLTASTAAELAALLEPVIAVMPLPEWCAVYRRITADNALMTKPATPALPHWQPGTPLAINPQRDAAFAMSGLLGLVESLGAEASTPLDRLQQIASARSKRLGELSEALQHLKALTATASLWICQLTGSPAEMAGQITTGAPNDYSQVMTVGAVMIANSPLMWWQEMLA